MRPIDRLQEMAGIYHALMWRCSTPLGRGTHRLGEPCRNTRRDTGTRGRSDGRILQERKGHQRGLHCRRMAEDRRHGNNGCKRQYVYKRSVQEYDTYSQWPEHLPRRDRRHGQPTALRNRITDCRTQKHTCCTRCSQQRCDPRWAHPPPRTPSKCRWWGTWGTRGS